MPENKQYGKPARPFELWNIGNYETVYWQEKQDEFLDLMLIFLSGVIQISF